MFPRGEARKIGYGYIHGCKHSIKYFGVRLCFLLDVSVCIADSFLCSVPEEPKLDVYVGPQKRHFTVSRSLLCTNSIDLDHFLNVKHAKTPRASLYLKNDEPEAFDLLVNWLLHDSLALELFETIVLIEGKDQKTLGDGCHVLCELYCLSTKVKLAKNWLDIIDKIRILQRHGEVLPLQLRTIRTVLKKLPQNSALSEYVLQEVANDLLDENGHDYEYFDELLEGPNAIPGLVKALIKKMKRKKQHGSQQQGASQNLSPTTMLEGESV